MRLFPWQKTALFLSLRSKIFLKRLITNLGLFFAFLLQNIKQNIAKRYKKEQFFISFCFYIYIRVKQKTKGYKDIG